MSSSQTSQTREAHLLHASVTAPLGPMGEDAEGGRGRIHVAVDSFFFFFFLRLETSFVLPTTNSASATHLWQPDKRNPLSGKWSTTSRGIESHACGPAGRVDAGGTSVTLVRSTKRERKRRKHKQQAHRNPQWAVPDNVLHNLRC